MVGRVKKKRTGVPVNPTKKSTDRWHAESKGFDESNKRQTCPPEEQKAEAAGSKISSISTSPRYSTSRGDKESSDSSPIEEREAPELSPEKVVERETPPSSESNQQISQLNRNRSTSITAEDDDCVVSLKSNKKVSDDGDVGDDGIDITQRKNDENGGEYDGAYDDDNAAGDAEAFSGGDDYEDLPTSRSKRSGTRPSEKLLRSRHESACRYLRMGHFDKALRKFKDVKTTLVEYYGHDHHRVGACLHNTGIVHLRAGNLDDAMRSLEQAVQIRKRTLGNSHPKVADSLVELGIILLSKREYDDAQDVFNEALELRERERGNSTHDEDENLIDNKVAKVLNNLGCVHYEYGDLREARNTFEEALEIQREVIGDGDPGTEPGCLAMASTMCNIGYVYLEGKKYEDAIVIMEEANEILQAILEPENKLVLNTLDNLAYAYVRSGNYDAGLKYYEEKYLNERDVNAQGSDRLECADTLRKMGYCHLKLTNHEKALDALRKAEAIQRDHLPRDSRKLQRTRELIGMVNYQILKFPGPKEIFFRVITRTGLRNPFDNGLCECTCAAPTLYDDEIGQHIIKRPQNSSKMSGHKVTYA